MTALIFSFLALCVTSEQRRNLRILYDALGTLADAVGAELNQVFFSSFLYHQELIRFFHTSYRNVPL
jgi:hypothetical protein